MTKSKKRSLTLLALIMFVSAAVLLNWSYNKRWGKADAEMVSAEDKGIAEAAERAQKLAASASGYFSEARLTRQVSRDEALQLLQTAASSEAASQETIDTAMNAISAMATCSMKESQIENLLLAKDFADCVVYIGNDAVTVAVPAPEEGLSEEAVARITDIILTETSYEASQLNIIEVRA
ncbi:MAG: SpoIIIAH-like family protein [Oscillospiraceae bacterium]|nr:SpoIIIAH-like family protein [Oscillospiraceae bacterium]